MTEISVLDSRPPAAGGRPPAQPSTRRKPRRLPWIEVCASIGGLLVWEFVSRTGIAPSSELPPASAAIAQLVELTGTSAFWDAVANTMSTWALAMVIAVVVLIPLGLVIGLVPYLFPLTRLTLDVMRSIPPVALLPLLILQFGTTEQMKLYLILFGIGWPLLVQAIYAAPEVDPVARQMTIAYQISGFTRFRLLVLPSSAQFLATGIRLAAVSGLLLALTGEYLGNAPGIGLEMAAAQNNGNIDVLYAYILVTVILGILINGLLTIAQRRVIFWIHRRGKDAR